MSPSLNVLVDGRPFFDASRYRGIGVYLRGVTAALARRGEMYLTALVRPGTPLPPGVKPARILRVAPGRWADREHDLLLPWDIRIHSADVFHSSGVHPPTHCAKPWVQTLHDTIPLSFNDPQMTGPQRRWIELAKRIRRADAIIAVSEHVAASAVETLGVDASIVRVAYHGLDQGFRPPAVRTESDPPYLVCVSEFDPRKGYREAFEVIAALRLRGLPHTLKMVGRLTPWTEPEIRAIHAASGAGDAVEFLGFVEHKDLPLLLQSASAMIVTSRFEGFGLPALEGMATGTAVVAFANTSTAEIVDGGGVLVPDGNVAAMVDEVEAILTSPARRRSLEASGVRRAGAFTWEHSAEIHAQVFSEVAT